MTKVFIGGSRRVTRLPREVQARLDRIMEKGFPVVVGDANGADKAVQAYLHRNGYLDVEVFCSGTRVRNNVGCWPLQKVPVPGRKSNLEFYTAKDLRMTEEASVGLMIWDGKSRGTLSNVSRLIEQRKPVALYVVPERVFRDFKSPQDWKSFVSVYPGAEREPAADERPVRRREPQPRVKQANLFQD